MKSLKEPTIVAIGGGERLYLEPETIYAFNDRSDKEFYISGPTFHVSSEQLKQMVFFNTSEEAVAAGYTSSQHSMPKRIWLILLIIIASVIIALCFKYGVFGI
jgi:hypothetical protein